MQCAAKAASRLALGQPGASLSTAVLIGRALSVLPAPSRMRNINVAGSALGLAARSTGGRGRRRNLRSAAVLRKLFPRRCSSAAARRSCCRGRRCRKCRWCHWRSNRHFLPPAPQNRRCRRRGSSLGMCRSRNRRRTAVPGHRPEAGNAPGNRAMMSGSRAEVGRGGNSMGNSRIMENSHSLFKV